MQTKTRQPQVYVGEGLWAAENRVAGGEDAGVGGEVPIADAIGFPEVIHWRERSYRV